MKRASLTNFFISYQDKESQEHGVVEEDGVGGGLVLGNL